MAPVTRNYQTNKCILTSREGLLYKHGTGMDRTAHELDLAHGCVYIYSVYIFNKSKATPSLGQKIRVY